MAWCSDSPARRGLPFWHGSAVRIPARTEAKPTATSPCADFRRWDVNGPGGRLGERRRIWPGLGPVAGAVAGWDGTRWRCPRRSVRITGGVIGQAVRVRLTANELHVFDGSRLAAVHPRLAASGKDRGCRRTRAQRPASRLAEVSRAAGRPARRTARRCAPRGHSPAAVRGCRRPGRPPGH